MSRLARRAVAVCIGLVAVVAASVVATVSITGTTAGTASGSERMPTTNAEQRASNSTGVTATSAAMSEQERLRQAQRTLARLGYQVDKITGEYDSETTHALVAFQKVHGLERTGKLNEPTRTWLRDPLTIRPQSAGSGFHIETDLTRQVAYTVRDGKVDKIYDVSTGKGRPPGVEPGSAADHSTPVGRFQVHYRIDGMEYAPLGNLYRPIYFTRTGIAFHGAQPVKPQPASHGCVRMTDPSIDELFGQLDPGTPVVVYRS